MQGQRDASRLRAAFLCAVDDGAGLWVQRRRQCGDQLHVAHQPLILLALWFLVAHHRVSARPNPSLIDDFVD